MKSVLALVAAVALGVGIYAGMSQADPAKPAEGHKEEVKPAREAAWAAQAAVRVIATAEGSPEETRVARDRARAARAATGATRADAGAAAWYAVIAVAEACWYAASAGDRAAARKRQCDLLRDVLGGAPGPPLPAAALGWNDGLVVRIARAIYEGRRWADLSILSDALLDAGCEDEALLDHCRRGGEHARGCFALDALLGNS